MDPEQFQHSYYQPNANVDARGSSDHDPPASPGGKGRSKAPLEAQTLLQSFIVDYDPTVQTGPAIAVYRAYERACAEKNITPLSSTTFYRKLKHHRQHGQTQVQPLAKAAHAQEARIVELTQATLRHGQRPFAIAHIYHTELDVVLASSVTGKPLGKPWVTFLIDAYSCRILSIYLTFDPPDFYSCIMVLRICVQRFGRLPEKLVLDNAREFHNSSFDAFLARYHITKKQRPRAKTDASSVIERLFGVTNSEFVHNLFASTHTSGLPSSLSQGGGDPQRSVQRHLADLYGYLDEWAYNVYDQKEHPALSQSPHDAFTHGLLQTEEREHQVIPYTEEFLMASLPSTRKGTARVERGRGIKIHGIYYSTGQFRSPDIEGTDVAVRYDPFDIGIAYALVNKQWIHCISQYYTILQGHTEKEMRLAAQEIQQPGKNRTATARRLANLLTNVSEYKAIQEQRLRDLDAKTVLEAIAASQEIQRDLATDLSDDGHASVTASVKPIDIASLTVFDEFR